MTAKVLMVGLDAADRQLVDSLIETGRLPTLKRLSERGMRGKVQALPGLGDDAVWMSFATGVGPGVHGRFYHQRFDGFRLVPHRRDAAIQPPFWEELAESGLKVAAIDVPKSPMGRVDNGVVIADWMCHGADTHAVVRSPDPLPVEFDRWITKPGPFECDELERNEIQTAEFEGQLKQRAQLRSDALTGLLSTSEWDLFLAVYAETHCVGHQCWHHHDPSHPDYSEEIAKACGNAIETIYSEVDAHLEKLIEAAGPGAIVIVFSLLGMGPNYSGTHLLSELCARIEERRGSVERLLRPTTQFVRNLGKTIPPVGKVADLLEAGLRFTIVPADLPTTLIRHRRLDRDEQERENACRELRDELMNLEDPTTRRKLVADVIFSREAFKGPHAEDFCDLLVLWEQNAPITSAYSPTLGTINGSPQPLRTGNHRDGGWYIASGSGIKSAAFEESMEVTDFASAVAKQLDARFDAPHEILA